MASRSDREDRPRRRRRSRAKPVRLDERIDQALANAGLPEVGHKVGEVVGNAISNAAHEIDRNLDRTRDRQRSRKPRKRRKPREPEPQKIDILWGMLEFRRTPDGAEHIGILWGLLDVRTRSRAADPGEDAQEGDPVQAAVRRAESRLEHIRAACILGSVGLGFSWLSLVSDAGFWSGVWGVASVSLFAVAGGLCLAAFTERFRRRWIQEELERAQPPVERDASADHARATQELTASIAHEIRNPITAAKSLVQQMGEDLASSENVEYARVALDELERVERSVLHLLRFARDEEISLEEVRMAEVVGDALATIKDRAEQARVGLESEIDSEGLMAGDPEKLRRVILNLVGNAIDALEASDTVRPSVCVLMGDNLAGTRVWVRVRDNGPGMTAEVQQKIWSPFHTTKEPGTGLGLAITKKLVEGHGGTIELSSSPGKGAEFVLTFPKVEEDGAG